MLGLQRLITPVGVKELKGTSHYLNNRKYQVAKGHFENSPELKPEPAA
jgi:hypothetical protein